MIQRRYTVFIGGYDPKSPRRLYEPMQQAARADGGAAWYISDVDASDPLALRWEIRSPEGTHTRFDALRWDDLVRENWARKPQALISESWQSLKLYVRTGGISRLYRLAHPPVYAAMLPFALVALAIVLPLAVGCLIAGVARYWHVSWLGAIAGGAIGALLVGAAATLVVWRTPSTWFLRVVAFARHYAHESLAQPGVYRHRIAAWAERIRRELAAQAADELLVVGYSAGSILATGLVAQLQQRLPPNLCVSLLVLGNCIPAAACLPQAGAVHADIASFAQSPSVWLDVTSPADWGSFHGLDCGEIYGQAPKSARRAAISPRFHTLFDAERYAKIKRDKYLTHQQYWLPSGSRPDPRLSYSFLHWVAGPTPLSDRLPDAA